MIFRKAHNGLAPDDDATMQWFAKLKAGAVVHGKLTTPRNLGFLRKFFAMLHVAYDNYDWPDVETKFGTAKCSFETFRSYVIVKAGHYDIDVTPDGNFRPRAKSIAFSKMDDAEFESVYSSVLDVILQRFLTNWKTDDMDRAVQEFILGFAQ